MQPPQPHEHPVLAPRVGVIGTGGRATIVLRILRELAPEITITALCDPFPDALDAFRQAVAPVAVTCGTVDELCAREDVDWVFVSSWNCQHAEHTCAAFKAGKHVFCEKPLALSIDEALAMYDTWQASGRQFVYGLVLRHSPLYQKAHTLLAEGHIGKLLSFEFNETLVFNHGGYIHGNWRRHRRFAGTHLMEKCCHDLDLALWLTNDLPARVASFGGCSFFRPEFAGEIDRIGPSPTGQTAFRTIPDAQGINPFNSDKTIVDHQVAILEFTRGVRATFHTQCVSALPERRFYLQGSEGTMRLDAYSGRIELRRLGWNEPVRDFSPAPGDSHAGGDRPMTLELVQIMRGERRPSVGFTEGIRAVAAALAVDAALDTGAVVDVAPYWSAVARALPAVPPA
ncbi:Gfo/Idh/MocA family oxidoreductase [Opitutus sp. ER46]|uniref:Gfo/Idh/MocA family protein n=1 Tax=Opitutus sp. ER46 TaxID=2161864 RepID=UPI000D31A949|nr:Gfo/Idh/MocA family oxidoreductase [Opitutus sp. ER46]PTX94343.1 gfo/Idh/MocA family oxidoreductase [Opitutus sp. ER46]